MGKYSKFSRAEYKRPYDVHPVWRGIGCILIIIAPIVSYAGAQILIQYAIEMGLGIPRELMGNLHFPNWVWGVPILTQLATLLAGIPNFYAVLICFFVFLILFSGLLSTLYSFMYRTVGPSRYSSIDSPPISKKDHSYRR